MVTDPPPDLGAWVTKAGLAGKPEPVLVAEFCRRAVALGVPLARVVIAIDTLHPIHEGRAFRWRPGQATADLFEYGRSTEGEAAENWRRSPWYAMLQAQRSELRIAIAAGPAETEPRYPIIEAFRAEG